MEKRPELQCNAVVAHVAEKLAKEVKAWAQEDDAIETYVSHLEDTLKNTHSFDGYDLAQELESAYGYSPDANLVDILDNADMYAHNKHRELVALWVKRNDIKPRYKVGDKVLCSSRSFTGTVEAEGEIMGFNTEIATYTVMCEKLGHVREGCGIHGFNYPFEDLEDFNDRRKASAS